MFFSRRRTELVSPDRALHGRAGYDFTIPARHAVNAHPLQPPFPVGLQSIVFGLGCFWGAEEVFWSTPGVWTTAVGYAGGFTPYPSYEEVCSGLTGHTEAVLVVFDPAAVSVDRLLGQFFEGHDPTQGMRQGNDVGTQYRSAIYYCDDAQRVAAEAAKAVFTDALARRGHGPATTELAALGEFYYAEAHHQQYLAKQRNGYRCHSTTGITFPYDALSQH